MKLHVDLETLQLIEGAGFRTPQTTLRFKRGDAARLEVIFLRDGSTPVVLGDPATLRMHFGVKPRNRFDSGYLVHCGQWLMPEPGAPDPLYVGTPGFNTVELDAFFNLGAVAEQPEVTLMGEISWSEAGSPPTSTRTFLVVVENDVNRGNEALPTPLGTNRPASSGGALIDPAVTGPDGDAPLAAKPSAALPTGSVLGIVPDGRLAFYQLRPGTEETTPPGIVRPDDWHPQTNARVWVQIL